MIRDTARNHRKHVCNPRGRKGPEITNPMGERS